ncbi:MAG TPA: sulfite exporter TauE/SafE family protein [Hyphomicrobiaceae bacterium]|nr:sulfite exporter TauE/SafE family protein [Hyphomicrobiaceae bacterium]
MPVIEHLIHAIHWLYVLSGFAVGFLVGLTGVGGGSLMTPLLVLLFGVHPATAVGTDLLYACVTKSGGSAVHAWHRTIDWRIVGRLAMGSVPAAILTISGLAWLNVNSEAAKNVITLALGPALMLTALALVFRQPLMRFYHNRVEEADPKTTARTTVVLGAVLGCLVTLSSVGAGALGVTFLIILYPKLPVARIVGSDIAHAVPLTLVSGMGHWLIGSVDLAMLGSLLLGSLPGIVIASFLAPRWPEQVLRYLLAAVLVLVSVRLMWR